MNLTKQVGLVVGSAALALTSGSFADTTAEANNNDLKAEVAELKAQMAQMRAQQNDAWLTEQRADEIRGLVQDVLADADMRASLLSQGMSAGYDDGFVLSSADGNFLLRINGQLQTRWVYNNADGGLGNLDQDDIDDVFDGEVGFGVLAAAVRANLSDSQLDALLSLDDALADEFLESIINFDRAGALQAQIDAFVLAAFTGLSSSDQDAVVQALGIDGVDTFAEYQSFITSEARSALMTAINVARSGDSSRSGFENSRTKLWFSGHVVNSQWNYMIEADFGTGGNFSLLDAYIAYDYGDGWTAIMGQFKAPSLREELVDSRYQLAVERSLLNSAFTAGRMQGIAMDYRGDQWHFTGSFSNGAASTNSTSLTEDTEWALASRVEYLFSGTWDQFSDFTSPTGEETGLMVGAAVRTETEEYGTGFIDPLTSPVIRVGNNNELETLLLTADVSAEFGGANLYGQFIYRNLDPNTGGDLDQYGFLVQGGYYLSDDWEVFVRYEWADFDIPDLTVPGGVSIYSWDDLSVITFGVNRYFASHQAKWTTDFGIGLDRVEFFVADGSAGYRSDTGGDDGQFVIRTQLQLLF